jgi:hypothetical protein
MSLRDLALQRLARIDETTRETATKQVEQLVPCFTGDVACFNALKHDEPQKTAISDACFTVSLPRGETHETGGNGALLSQWRSNLMALRLDRPRGGILPARWRALLLDAADLFNGWGPQAAALGWTGAELFGVDPSLRLDHQALHSLAWRCDGFRVAALTDYSASLEGKAALTPGKYYRGDASRLIPIWRLPA